jgi:hypothetical protein
MREIAHGIKKGDFVQCQFVERLFSPTGNIILGYTSHGDTFLVTEGATSNFFQSHVEVLHLTLGRVRISSGSLEVISAAG